MDLNEESDDDEEDFDAWKPDPVDADPSKQDYVDITMIHTRERIPCSGLHSL